MMKTPSSLTIRELTMCRSVVIDELQGSLASGGCPIAFWYVDYMDQDSQTPSTLFSSLLRQIASTIPELPTTLVTAYERFCFSSLPLHELQGLLIDIITTYRTADRVYIIVDALDECSEFIDEWYWNSYSN